METKNIPKPAAKVLSGEEKTLLSEAWQSLTKLDKETRKRLKKA